MSKEILIHSIQLIKAIEKNDLTQTIENVKFLNNNFTPDKFQYLNAIIPFEDLIYQLKENESLYYAITHLNNLQNIEEIQWAYEIAKLNDNPINNQKIENFLIDFLNNTTQIKEFQGPILIQYAVTVGRTDLLDEIRKKLEQIKEV